MSVLLVESSGTISEGWLAWAIFAAGIAATLAAIFWPSQAWADRDIA